MIQGCGLDLIYMYIVTTRNICNYKKVLFFQIQFLNFFIGCTLITFHYSFVLNILITKFKHFQCFIFLNTQMYVAANYYFRNIYYAFDTRDRFRNATMALLHNIIYTCKT